MIIKYKWTTQACTTHAGFQWPEPGVWVRTNGEGELCGAGWLHCYDHPLLAVLHNPIHADIQNGILWAVEVQSTEKRDGQLKSGWTEMRLIQPVTPPVMTLTQIVAYGILTSMEVYKDKKYTGWAEKWLNGEDRTGKSAAAAVDAAWA